MVLSTLKEVRSRQSGRADVEIVERWIERVAGVQANLDAITDWSSAEMYDVNVLHLGDALRRLFPNGLADGGDFALEVGRLETELARDWNEQEPPPPVPPLTADDALEEILTSHASARFRYLDVRDVAEWRRRRLECGVNVPLERLTDEAPQTFRNDTDLVVYGGTEEETNTAALVLERLGLEHLLRIPGGFSWFERRGWRIDRGPG